MTALILSVTKPGADDSEIPGQHFLVSFLSGLGLFVGLFSCARSGAITHPPTPNPSLHSQTSRNETRFCHPDCGGALSAALTCTGRRLHSVELYAQLEEKGDFSAFVCFSSKVDSSHSS